LANILWFVCTQRHKQHQTLFSCRDIERALAGDHSSVLLEGDEAAILDAAIRRLLVAEGRDESLADEKDEMGRYFFGHDHVRQDEDL